MQTFLLLIAWSCKKVLSSSKCSKYIDPVFHPTLKIIIKLTDMKIKRVLDFCNSAHWKNVKSARLLVPPLDTSVGLIPEFLFPALQTLKLDALRLTTDHEFVVVCPDYTPENPYSPEAVNYRTEKMKDAIQRLIDASAQFADATAPLNHVVSMRKASAAHVNRPPDVVDISEGWMAPPLAYVDAAACGLLGVRTYHAAANILRPPTAAADGVMVFERPIPDTSVIGVAHGADDVGMADFDASITATAAAVDRARLLRAPCVTLLVAGAARAAALAANASPTDPAQTESDDAPAAASAVNQLAAALHASVGIPASGSTRRLVSSGAVSMCRYDAAVGFMADTRFVYDLTIPRDAPLHPRGAGGLGGHIARGGGGGSVSLEEVPLNQLLSRVEDGAVDPVDAVGVLDFATRVGLLTPDTPLWVGAPGVADHSATSGYPFALRSLRWAL